MQTFSSSQTFGVVVKQLTPSFSEFTLHVSTSGVGVQQYVTDYLATLHPDDPTYTYRIKLIEELGVVCLTD